MRLHIQCTQIDSRMTKIIYNGYKNLVGHWQISNSMFIYTRYYIIFDDEKNNNRQGSIKSVDWKMFKNLKRNVQLMWYWFFAEHVVFKVGMLLNKIDYLKTLRKKKNML